MLMYWIYILCLISLVKLANGCPGQCNCQGNAVVCTNKNIRNPPKSYPAGTHSVNLNQNRITVLGPRSFQRQQTLEIMKINGNNIRVIRAYAFRPFSNLLTLDLSNNQIVKIYGRGFKGMNKVRTLSLSNNRLRSVTRIFLSTPNLFQLNLGFNQIRKLGEGDFGANSDLHYLDLRNNKISTIHRNTFKNLVKLRTLFLNNNPLSNIPAELKFGSQILQLLDFSSCQLEVVPKGLPSSLEDLRFGRNRLTRINQSDLANVTGLKMITFNENQIERFEYHALGNARSLEEVWLRANKLVYIPRGFPDSVKKIHMHSNMVHQIEGRLFTDKSQLEYLDVSNNHVSNISTEAFTGLMKLQTIKFEGNQLSDLKPGTFENLETLKSIYLGNNPIETIQAGAFYNLPNLTTLTLNYNPNEQVQINENFLLEMPNLETLNLMASIGMSKTILEIIQDNNFVMEHMTEVILTYNNLRKLSSSFRDTFPNIEKLPIDGNAWICDYDLLWLKQWMQSTIGEITFHEYNSPKCETPFGLTGSHIIDVRDSDFVEHNEGLLNDFPYWVIEEEFNKAQDEKERKAREEKEKKDKYHKNKFNKAGTSENTKTSSKVTNSNAKATKTNSKDTKNKSKDQKDTKEWYPTVKNDDPKKPHHKNKDILDPKKKQDGLPPQKGYNTNENFSDKKHRNIEENQNKKHSINRHHLKKDKTMKDPKLNSDKTYLKSDKKRQRNPEEKSKQEKSRNRDRQYFRNKDKIENGFNGKDKTQYVDDSKNNQKYNNKEVMKDKFYPKDNHHRDSGVKTKKKWDTSASKKTDVSHKKDSQLDQKKALDDKDTAERKLKSIPKDKYHNPKFRTKFDNQRKRPVKKSQNSKVTVPLQTTDVDKSSTDKEKDVKQFLRKAERKRKRKDRRRKCERNGKKCRKRKRKRQKTQKKAKTDKI